MALRNRELHATNDDDVLLYIILTYILLHVELVLSAYLLLPVNSFNRCSIGIISSGLLDQCYGDLDLLPFNMCRVKFRGLWRVM